MAHSGWRVASRGLRAGVGFLVAALVLASCGAHHNVAVPRPAPTATTFLNPHSICGSDEGDSVHQTLNGDFTACFRVPELQSSTDTVALSAYLSGTTPSSNEPTTTFASTSAHDRLTLSMSRKTVTPGETVTVIGHLQQPLSQKQPLPTLCWGGCNGLTEQASTPHWTSPTEFRMKLLVPDTAWLEIIHGRVTVHPLTSGRYDVAIQCVTSISGCAREPGEARTSVYLKAPKPSRCVKGKQCETLSLSSTRAAIGDQVLVKGWAPLQTIIGQPFNYSLSVTPGAPPKHYPSLAYGDNLKGGGLNVVLTPRTLHVEAAPTWASLGRVAYISSTYSGTSAIDAAPNSPLVAWCQPSGIVVTGGATTMTVPTKGVGSALKGSTLRLYSSPRVVPQCVDVQLDPRFGESFYAAFGTAHGNSIPPVYLAPLYTTNGGATWRTVPIPSGQSIENFSGFSTEGNSVAALFTASNNDGYPYGTDRGYVPAEVTSNGGLTWTSSTLGCSTSGPCVTFGTYFWGYCNMSNQNEPILLGPPGTVASTGIRWSSPSWPSSLNSCFPQQLVVSTAHNLELLDPSSEYPMLISTDAGRTWSYRALPLIKAANYGLDSVPASNALVLAPDGSLFASVTTTSGDSQELFRLSPSASAWCEIPHAFGALISVSGAVSPLRVNETDLLWSQTVTANSGAITSTSIHAEALSKLVC
jgi:hypothetical protein